MGKGVVREPNKRTAYEFLPIESLKNYIQTIEKCEFLNSNEAFEATRFPSICKNMINLKNVLNLCEKVTFLQTFTSTKTFSSINSNNESFILSCSVRSV